MNLEFPPFSKGQMIPQIGRTSKFMGLLVKTLFNHHKIDLSKEQFILLLFVEVESKPQSSLASITERDKGSLTRLVQSLEKKGYVKRRVCGKDSRVNYVEIDDLGRSVIEKAKPIIQELFDSLKKGIDPKHNEIAMQVLKQIQENAFEEFELLEKNKNSK